MFGHRSRVVLRVFPLVLFLAGCQVRFGPAPSPGRDTKKTTGADTKKAAGAPGVLFETHVHHRLQIQHAQAPQVRLGAIGGSIVDNDDLSGSMSLLKHCA